jgi:hypothetical protein
MSFRKTKSRSSDSRLPRNTSNVKEGNAIITHQSGNGSDGRHRSSFPFAQTSLMKGMRKEAENWNRQWRKEAKSRPSQGTEINRTHGVARISGSISMAYVT